MYFTLFPDNKDGKKLRLFNCSKDKQNKVSIYNPLNVIMI